MNWRSLFIVCLALFTLSAARPKNKNLALDSESETKIREKRKYELPLLRQLEEGGVGVKRETPPVEPEEEAGKAPKPKGAEAEEAAAAEKGGDKGDGGEAEDTLAGALRVKKQSPNNIGGCGKTVCGPIVSASGPVVGDMRAMLQGGKPLLPLGPLGDLHAAAVNEMNDAVSKLEHFSPVQGRTVDTIVAPVALSTMSSLGYGTPAAYAAPPAALDLANSFLKPPAALPSVTPAVAVITTPHQPSHSLLHPMLLPHLMPHLVPHVMPALMSGIGSYFTPHRMEPVRFPEPIPTEIKQPVPSYPQPYYTSSVDNTLLCQPLRNQRLDLPQEYFYKPDLAADKSINITEGRKKSQGDLDEDEDRRIRDHLRKVNEIKDEISQLNRAAQRIVDQQERLTAMHQRQLWGSSGGQATSEQTTNPYMGSGYYAHPSVPWGYSRSNILSYPRSQDDIDFFVNLLRAGKKMGLLSDVVQPSVLSTIGEVFKGVQDGGKTQKDATDGVGQSTDNVSKQDKKLTK